MNLLQIVPSISEESDGVANFSLNLADFLQSARSDLNLEMVTLNWTPMTKKVPYAKHFSLGLGPKSLGRSPDMLAWLNNRVKSTDRILAHNHGLWTMPNVYAGAILNSNKVTLMVSPHGTLSEWSLARNAFIKTLFWRFLQKPALKKASCFHATCEEEYLDIRRMGFTQPVSIIPCGVKIPSFTKKPDNQPKTLLFLARMHPKKGVDILLKAWCQLQHSFPDWDLHIAGSDSDGYLEEMKALSGSLSNERVFFRGSLHGEEKNQAYREATLYVLPTHNENFGITVAEALSMGTAVVVTKETPWQALEDANAGRWIDVGVFPLVTCLEDLMSLPQSDLNEMGLRGYNWVSQEFAWPIIASRFQQTYDWLAGEDACPPWVVFD
jgi:glycosyltransferase involved in cell wall biosynthesis